VAEAGIQTQFAARQTLLQAHFVLAALDRYDAAREVKQIAQEADPELPTPSNMC